MNLQPERDWLRVHYEEETDSSAVVSDFSQVVVISTTLRDYPGQITGKTFTITINFVYLRMEDVEGESDAETSASRLDLAKPSFAITGISSQAELKINFSQMMQVLGDLDTIDSTVLLIELERDADESDEAVDASNFSFVWNVISFDQTSLSIEIDWINSYYISQGTDRDIMTVTLLQSDKFVSMQTGLPVPAGLKISAKVPRQLPKSDASMTYIEATELSESITNAALVANFAVNVLMTGVMTYLWSMLNSLQIIAYFDLVNIVMPANAHQLFQILVSVATFDLIPAEPAIEAMESWVGLTNDEFAITDSFVDFEYY